MGAFISKYGVAVHVYIPVIKRGVVDFAVSADWTPSAGDVKISKDGGAAANVTNLPTAITMGNTAMWDFSMTATEMQAAKVMVTVADSATKAVEDTMFTIWTHGNASGQYQVDLADSVRAGLTALPNAAAEAAGGLYTRGSGAGQINQATNGQIDGNLVRIANVAVATGTAQLGVNVVSYASGQAPLQPTTAGRTLDVTATGEAGIDWANVGAPTTALNLSGTSISTSQAVASVTGAVGSVTGAVGSVTAGVTVTTNNDKTGYTLSNTGIDNILDRTDGVETSFTLRQALRLMLAALAGKLSGAATSTVTIRDVNDSKNRLVATVDADGNRSAVTKDVT